MQNSGRKLLPGKLCHVLARTVFCGLMDGGALRIVLLKQEPFALNAGCMDLVFSQGR